VSSPSDAAVTYKCDWAGFNFPGHFYRGHFKHCFGACDLGGDVSAAIQARSDHYHGGVGAEAGACHNDLVTMPQVPGGVLIEFKENSYPVRRAEGRALSG